MRDRAMEMRHSLSDVSLPVRLCRVEVHVTRDVQSPAHRLAQSRRPRCDKGPQITLQFETPMSRSRPATTFMRDPLVC